MIRTESRVERHEYLPEVAVRAWVQALSDFYNPPLPDPEVEHMEKASSYFYIDSTTWTVHLNTAGVPLHLDANESEPFLRSISHHEIQHYLVCPYDGVTNGLMFSSARRHVNDQTAMLVCNLFADLVIDASLLKRFPRLTHERIGTSIHDSAIRISDHSDLWKLIIATYRAMWGFPIPSNVRIEDETYSVAESIVEVTRSTIHNEKRWPKATERIAKLIADWMPESDETLAGCVGFEGASVLDSGEAVSESPVQIPLDVDIMMGSPLEARNGDRAKRCIDKDTTPDLDNEMERLAVDVEQRGGTLEDLEGVYILAGIGSPSSEWIQFWYRAKVRGLIQFDVTEPIISGSAPLTPQVWRLGDPIEELDIVQSLQAFPVIVPNMSTRRWIKTTFMGRDESGDLPDLLLVIDSSGSMTWSMGSRRVSGPYHTALIAAFAAMDFALLRSKRISAINFSDGVRKCDWTRDRREIEHALLAYQGGGTVAPLKEIASSCNEADAGVMVLMITDAEIANWSRLVKAVKQIVQNGHSFFMFHIGAPRGRGRSKVTESFSKIGASAIPVESIKDLPGLVVKEAKRVYGRS
ncbi:MAG: hypothetical protein ACXAEB_00980 [Candidatus Thorarchaeota archaeon]|jgi:hypothetical protein